MTHISRNLFFVMTAFVATGYAASIINSISITPPISVTSSGSGQACVMLPSPVLGGCDFSQPSNISWVTPDFSAAAGNPNVLKSTGSLSQSFPIGTIRELSHWGYGSIAEQNLTSISFGLLGSIVSLADPTAYHYVVNSTIRAEISVRQLNRFDNLSFSAYLQSFSATGFTNQIHIDSANRTLSVSVDQSATGGITISTFNSIRNGQQNLLSYSFVNGLVDLGPTNTLGLILPTSGQSASFSIQIPTSFQVDLPDYLLSNGQINQSASTLQEAALTLAIPEPSTCALAALGLFALRRKANSNL